MSDEGDDDIEIEIKVAVSKEAHDLFHDGYCVLPCFTKREVSEIIEGLDIEIKETWFEFPSGGGKGGITSIMNLQKKGPKFVCGGFGACGNPSNFHMTMTRFMRYDCYTRLKNFFYTYMHRYVKKNMQDSWNFHIIHDRLMIRAIGDKATPEAWHRDTASSPYISNDKDSGDHIFGGWINLSDDSEQTFSCLKGTHKPGWNPNQGFKMQKPTSDEMAKKVSISIPPGHILIFYENIIHEVVSKLSKKVVVRLFTGWRFCKSDEPLVGKKEMNRVIDEQDICLLKSGQIPRMWPKLYAVNHIDVLNAWMLQMFLVNGGHRGAEAYAVFANVNQASMKPLKAYVNPPLSNMYPTYTDFERGLYFPHQLL